MYVVIDKLTNKATIVTDKTQVANQINVDRRTVGRNLKEGYWITVTTEVYKVEDNPLKSYRGKRK
jgi:hypothetical protein